MAIPPTISPTANMATTPHDPSGSEVRMRLLPSRKFIREHTFELVVAGLISVCGLIGTTFFAIIKSDIDQLQCRVSDFGAKNEFDSVQLRLIVTPLDDVKRNSDPVDSLSRVISGYRNLLRLCPEGKRTLDRIINYKDGLDAYIDRQWDKAIQKFELVTPRSTLSEKSVASALLHKYFQLNKLGNGNEASGDGYRFRGRGLIQLTGRNEYTEFGATIGMSAEQAAAFCETPEGAAISGCWYLSSRGCLQFADQWNLAEITKRVNGRRMLDHAKRVQYSNAMLAELNR